MRLPNLRRALCVVLALAVAPLCSSTAYAAFSDLSTWVGVDNTSPANNYTVTSQTSAGGTFAERRLNAASLGDDSLAGGPFDWNSPLAMSGTIQFTNVFDPVLFFGWYNSANLNERIGLGIANPIPAGGGIRWQAQNGNTGATGVVSQDIGEGATATERREASTLAPGTYPFTFVYDGNGHMTGTFDTIVWARNYAAPTNQDLNMDRFGFLQKSSADDNVNTFTLNISDINYTGQSLVPEPSWLVLAGYALPVVVGFRPRRTRRRR